MEFDITQAAKNWLSGQPNYGVVISATNEEIQGREARFYSREHGSDWRLHPIMSVLCHYTYDSGSPIIQTQLESTTSNEQINVFSNAPQNRIPVLARLESTSSGQIFAVCWLLIVILWMSLLAKININGVQGQ